MSVPVTALREAWRDYRRHFRELWIASAAQLRADLDAL